MIIQLLIWGILVYNPYHIIYKEEDTMPKPPMAKTEAYSYGIHGVTIEDPYHWLRDKNWPDKVEDKEILKYLNAENDYFKSFMDPLENHKNMIFEELKGRIKLEDQSTYVKKDDYYYYSRTYEDKDYTVYCRKRGSTEGKEEVLLDVNKLAEGKKFLSIGAFSISPNHRFMAYSSDSTGGEKYIIKIFDLEKQQYLPDEIENTIGGIVWLENNAGFFYTPVDDSWRHDKVLFHKLGDDVKNDQLILHEKDPLYSVSVSKSSSRRYIFIDVNGHDSNETYYFPIDSTSFAPVLVKQRADKVHYSVDHGNGYFYMHTNYKKNSKDLASNFQLLRASDDEDLSLVDTWQGYIPEDKEKYLSSFDITMNYLILNYRNNGLPLVKVCKTTVAGENADNKEKIIKFPDEAYTASAYSTNFEENDLRLDYSSLNRPSTVYQYDFEEDCLNILKTQEIPSGFNPNEYETKRIFARSGEAGSEEVLVPITILYKKSLFKADGSNPLYLYGYGSYGHSMSVSFRNSAISLVNRGIVYAIAHIRGGSDLGHDWYEAAKFLTKKRTFEDFIAVADELINRRYTSSGNVVIAGGSAGGMLIGNVINQRPELFKAAIAHVPFVDVLNTMLDETLPLTPGEFKEWGNPKEQVYFEYIKTYSPYDNITAQNYPNLFVTAGLSDPRVGYWEAAKWVARLRATKTDNNMIILKTNMDFGHSGASARFDYLKEAAEDIIFVLKMFGLL